MTIGFSLSPQLLLNEAHSQEEADLLAHFGNAKSLLKQLKKEGVTSIEIRYLPREVKDEAHERVCDLIWNEGLELTVHGNLAGNLTGNKFTEIYPAMNNILTHYSSNQKEIMMAIHAYNSKEYSLESLSDRTVAILQDWLEKLTAEQLPIRFAIELNHVHQGIADPGSTCEGLLQMIEKINSPMVGVTWDMGHYYSNMMKEAKLDLPPSKPIEHIPPDSFLRNTIHTHIHGMGPKGAHYPLTEQESLPLELYVQNLKRVGYSGVYNLELAFSKFPDDMSVATHVMTSITRLRDCVLS